MGAPHEVLKFAPGGHYSAPRIVENRKSSTGFAIGWDYASHDIPLRQGVEAEVIAGHLAGREHFRGRRPLKHDRFIRKHLLLRLNAWRRNRMVDAGVTPEYLAAITPLYCPITRERLTISSGKDTDWSVDRVLNNAGYAPGNLAMISTGANTAKATLEYSEILAIIAEGGAKHGLCPKEWARVAAMVGMVADSVSLIPLLVMPPPRMLVTNRFTMLQVGVMYAAADAVGPRLGADLRQCCHGKASKRALTALLEVARGKMRHGRIGALPTHELHWMFEDAWQDGMLMRYFRAWVDTITAADQERCIAVTAKHTGTIKRAKEGVREAWAENTGVFAAAA